MFETFDSTMRFFLSLSILLLISVANEDKLIAWEEKTFKKIKQYIKGDIKNEHI